MKRYVFQKKSKQYFAFKFTMCGIFVGVHFECDGEKCRCANQIDEKTHELLKNRGPNAHEELNISCNNFHLFFSGYVLWQQGDKLCHQPYSNDNVVLMMNGDIFSRRDDSTISDTEWLSNRINDCLTETSSFISLFQTLEGPYSITFFDKHSKSLYFIRDSLGRQSLLLAIDDNDRIIISSVLSKNQSFKKCIEIPPLGLFKWNLEMQNISIFPWHAKNDIFQEQLEELEKILSKQIEIDQCIDPIWLNLYENGSSSFHLKHLLSNDISKKPEELFEILLKNDEINKCCDRLIDALKRSLNSRISVTAPVCRSCLKLNEIQCAHARIGILFSGGIDCTILARLSSDIIDKRQPIDLINVSFEKIIRNKKNIDDHIDYNTPDRISANQTLYELKMLCPNRIWNLIEVNVTRNELDEMLQHKISHLVYPLVSVLDESLGAVLWFGANSNGFVNGQSFSSTCRILLIGSGADELFGGYTRHRNAFIRPHKSLSPYDNLEMELEFDFNRLPSRNLARDDRIIGDCGISVRSPFLEENFVHLVRNLRAHQRCFHGLEQGVGDKLLLRLCGYKIGLRQVTSLKKRAMQFGSRVADRKQNAKDKAISLM